MKNRTQHHAAGWCRQLAVLHGALVWAGAALAVPEGPPPPEPGPLHLTSNATPCTRDSSAGCPPTSNAGFDASLLGLTSLQFMEYLDNQGTGFATGTGGGIGLAGAPRYALGETGRAAAGAAGQWNAWGSLAQSHVAYSFPPLQSSGHLDYARAGADYTFGNRVVLGLAVSSERVRIGTSYNGGNLSGDGYSIAPYLAWPIDRNWVLGAAAGWGRTNINTIDNSTRPAGATASTRDNRGFASLGLSYNRSYGAWQLVGKGTLVNAQDRFNQFAETNGTFVNGVSGTITQARLGG